MTKQRAWQIRQKAKGLCRYCPTPAITADRCRLHAAEMSRRRTDAVEFLKEEVMPSLRECSACHRQRPLSAFRLNGGYRRSSCSDCVNERARKKANGGVVANLHNGPMLEKVYERQAKRLALAGKEACVCGCPDVNHVRGRGRCGCGRCSEYFERGA